MKSYKMTMCLLALNMVPLVFEQSSQSTTINDSATSVGKPSVGSCLEDSELRQVLRLLNDRPTRLAQTKLHSISLRIERNGRPTSVTVLDPQKHGVKELEKQIRTVCYSANPIARQRKINFVFLDGAKAAATMTQPIKAKTEAEACR
jgi:hypothetical protein